ncbi:hypothetical protein DPSP01_006911 [Paraphaeosphaeria sporulosa]
MEPHSRVLSGFYIQTSNGLKYVPGNNNNNDDGYAGDGISTKTTQPKVGDITGYSAGGNGKGIAGSNGPLKDLREPPK